MTKCRITFGTMKPSQRKSGGDGPGHPQQEQQQRPRRKRGRPRKAHSAPNPISIATGSSRPDPAVVESSPSPKRKKRGRPPRTRNDRAAASSGPRAEDVLTLRGAAAQQTVHPGNLTFYRLCENRYDEYASLPDGHPRRRSICQEIVDEVHRSGGTFRTEGGGTMDDARACEKARDRMRQIARPKIVPPSNVGDDDVVFKVGAANHLFPGNARWRALLDGYVARYWPDPYEDGRHKKKIRRKEPHQVAIIEEVISTVRARGGRFRGVDLRVLSHREIVAKVHSRFRDLKKDLRAGRFVDPQQGGVGGAKGQGRARTVRRTGCTSVKTTTVVDGEVPKGERKRKGRARVRRHDDGEEDYDDDDDDDEDSFDSAVLGSDDSDGVDSEEGGEGAPTGKAAGRQGRSEPVDEWEDMVARRPDNENLSDRISLHGKNHESDIISLPQDDEQDATQARKKIKKENDDTAEPTHPYLAISQGMAYV